MHELYVFILRFILGLGAGITIGSFFGIILFIILNKIELNNREENK
jgi:NhaP-type Na+/H+ and K+/H+ antiporter